jgi:hypothetical protein
MGSCQGTEPCLDVFPRGLRVQLQGGASDGPTGRAGPPGPTLATPSGLEFWAALCLSGHPPPLRWGALMSPTPCWRSPAALSGPLKPTLPCGPLIARLGCHPPLCSPGFWSGIKSQPSVGLAPESETCSHQGLRASPRLRTNIPPSAQTLMSFSVKSWAWMCGSNTGVWVGTVGLFLTLQGP